MVRRAALTVLPALTLSASARAQNPFAEPQPTRRQIVAGNVIVAGLTAAAHAKMSGRSVRRALAYGLIGGAVIAGGKAIGSGPGVPATIGGSLVGSLGTSLVASAGAGRHPFGELSLPIAMLRLRLTPFDEHKARVTINAWETGIIARSLVRNGTSIDWSLSAQLGTLVMNTDNREIVVDGRTVHGVTTGPAVVISEFSADPATTRRHEAVHVQQHRFAHEAWGLPVEQHFRKKRHGKWIPTWLELGVIAPIVFAADHEIGGRDRGLRRMRENDAEVFGRR